VRILLTGKHVPNGPQPIGGVQSWIATVAAELDRIGHDVTVWGPELGSPSGRYDLGIMANAEYTRAAFPLCAKTLLVSHGIIAPERPHGADRYCFTSEGVRDHWGLNAPIVRQPIDLEFWSDASRKRSGFVRYSYRAGLPWLGAVAAGMGRTYAHVRNVTHEAARDVLRRAECVFATGRAALEAAACGAPVVILDHRSTYQGELLAEFGTDQMRNNYSGRGGCQPTTAKVIELTERAIARGSQRGYVEWFHDVRNVVGGLL